MITTDRIIVLRDEIVFTASDKEDTPALPISLLLDKTNKGDNKNNRGYSEESS